MISEELFTFLLVKALEFVLGVEMTLYWGGIHV